MQLTTEERLDKIKSSFCKKKKGTEDLDILPNVIVFQNFREDCIYSVPLKVVNRSKVHIQNTFFQFFRYHFSEIIALSNTDLTHFGNVLE